MDSDRYGWVRTHTDAKFALSSPFQFSRFSVPIFPFFFVRIGTSPKPSRWVRTHPESPLGSRRINTDTYGYMRNLNQACQTHFHFSVFRIFYEVFPGQVPDYSQPKSFRGGQAIHILLDRYKRDMAMCLFPILWSFLL